MVGGGAEAGLNPRLSIILASSVSAGGEDNCPNSLSLLPREWGATLLANLQCFWLKKVSSSSPSSSICYFRLFTPSSSAIIGVFVFHRLPDKDPEDDLYPWRVLCLDWGRVRASVAAGKAIYRILKGSNFSSSAWWCEGNWGRALRTHAGSRPSWGDHVRTTAAGVTFREQEFCQPGPCSLRTALNSVTSSSPSSRLCVAAHTFR